MTSSAAPVISSRRTDVRPDSAGLAAPLVWPMLPGDSATIELDFAPWLRQAAFGQVTGDAIVSATAAVDAGFAVGAPAVSGEQVAVSLSADGTSGARTLAVTILTAQGRIKTAAVTVPVLAP